MPQNQPQPRPPVSKKSPPYGNVTRIRPKLESNVNPNVGPMDVDVPVRKKSYTRLPNPKMTGLYQRPQMARMARPAHSRSELAALASKKLAKNPKRF